MESCQNLVCSCHYLILFRQTGFTKPSAAARPTPHFNPTHTSWAANRKSQNARLEACEKTSSVAVWSSITPPRHRKSPSLNALMSSKDKIKLVNKVALKKRARARTKWCLCGTLPCIRNPALLLVMSITSNRGMKSLSSSLRMPCFRSLASNKRNLWHHADIMILNALSQT